MGCFVFVTHQKQSRTYLARKNFWSVNGMHTVYEDTFYGSFKHGTKYTGLTHGAVLSVLMFIVTQNTS